MQPTVLVPIDFSQCTGSVVQRAASLAAELDGRVVLMHAVKTPEGLEDDVQVGGGTTALELLQVDAREQLEEHAEELLARGVDVDLLVTSGAPDREILAAAEQLDVSYIVMGTHGRRGISRLVLGSVAERVTRRSSRPVVVVRSEWQPGCPSGGCAWCASGRTGAERQLTAEQDG